MQPKAQHRGSIQDAVLRSINVGLDAEASERIAHFRPTAKCVPLLEALLAKREQHAWMITAPYGSGKSLTASYLLHLVENRQESRSTLRSIEARLREVNPKLASFAARRRQSEKAGLTVSLEGHQSSVPNALKTSAIYAMERNKLGRQARPIAQLPCEDMPQAIELLSMVCQKLYEAGRDRLIIVWDEFGRHLEELVESGRAGELSDIQLLAEYVSREASIPVTLGVFLHQQLLSYADRATQAMRKEWAKVQGRFEQHQYIDDSEETLRLIADLVAENTTFSGERPTKRRFREIAKASIIHGWFPGWTQAKLSNLLSTAFPLEPAVLAFLPRISARVAQNERTLFSFLRSLDLKDEVGIDSVYDFFAPVMRADTGVGGAQRRWLETESALSKVDSEGPESKLLKTCSLLALGFGGERRRVGRDAACAAAAGFREIAPFSQAIDRLIDRKLLLHRKHSDQLALWHGTDVDIRAKLEQTKDSHRGEFDVLQFLREEAPAPVWKPVAHNDKFAIRRFIESTYHSPEELERTLGFDSEISRVPIGADGRLLYIISDDEQSLAAAKKTVGIAEYSSRVLICIADQPIGISDLALELQCLIYLQNDQELLAQDPLIASELDQFIDDARCQLKRAVQSIVTPEGAGSTFYASGNRVPVKSSSGLRAWLSQLMDSEFPKTPRVRNEMINRHNPSRVIVNARRKAEIAILERAGLPNLGLVGQTPDVSVFRSSLLLTGLYVELQNGTWGFEAPEKVEDPGLSEVWGLLKDFFSEPSEAEKNPKLLIEQLQQPPYGMRRGLIPLLFAAAYRAFAIATSITRDGHYIEDVLATDIEALIKSPERHSIRVLGLDKGLTKYLRDVQKLFHPAHEDIGLTDQDLVRACYDAIECWKQELPQASKESASVSSLGKNMQRVMFEKQEPFRLLLESFPALSGLDRPSAAVIKTLTKAKAELEDVPNRFYETAAGAIDRRLSVKDQGHSDALSSAAMWVSCFPRGLAEKVVDPKAKGLLDRLSMDYKKPEQLVNSLALLLIGKPVTRWTEASPVQFEAELDSVALQIEKLAMASGQTLAINGARTKLAELAGSRVSEWFDNYSQLVGREEIEEMLDALRARASLRNSQ